jgi:hypothetical protein
LAEENTFSQFSLFQGSDSSFKGSERTSPDDVAEENLLLNLLLGTESLTKGTEPLNKEDPLKISRYKEDPLEILNQAHLLFTEPINKEDPLEILVKEDSSKICPFCQISRNSGNLAEWTKSSLLGEGGMEVEKLVIKEIKVKNIVQVIQEVEGEKIVPQIEYREDLETMREVEVKKMVQVMKERDV